MRSNSPAEPGPGSAAFPGTRLARWTMRLVVYGVLACAVAAGIFVLNPHQSNGARADLCEPGALTAALYHCSMAYEREGALGLEAAWPGIVESHLFTALVKERQWRLELPQTVTDDGVAFIIHGRTWRLLAFVDRTYVIMQNAYTLEPSTRQVRNLRGDVLQPQRGTWGTRMR